MAEEVWYIFVYKKKIKVWYIFVYKKKIKVWLLAFF